MSRNLKDRLSRIRSTGGASAGRGSSSPDPVELTEWPLWTAAGYKTLKRELCFELPVPLVGELSGAMQLLVPDFARLGRVPSPGELLFFDLETTGLSGGAGTIAFLAAFGRLRDNGRLAITQYLLLDYPGEADFIEMAVKEFRSARSDGALPVVVSYNGKCFDSQILRNRCLMNGINVPGYYHADLLHPARRLWKRVLNDCSQSTVEVSVLGLDRTGDVSGAFAPEIWFSFLRSGDNRELISICDHNVKDIRGLAAIFLALAEISEAPLTSRDKYRFDLEALAVHWHAASKKNRFASSANESLRCHGRTGELLLKNAAESGSCRAAITLAIDAEWRLRDPALAHFYTLLALGNPALPENQREALEKRKNRLEKKGNHEHMEKDKNYSS